MKKNRIKIYHLLTYGNAIWPVSNYGQKQFFIWGPTSIANIIPSEFTKHYSFRSKIIEKIRTIYINTLKYNIGFQKRCKNANLIICKTTTTIQNIPKKFVDKSIVLTDVATKKINYNDNSVQSGKTVKYLSVGRLDGWRGFDLLIEAFKDAYLINPNICLEILGDGLEINKLKKLIKKFNLNGNIKLTGNVSQDEYMNKICSSDVVINPNLREGSVTTSFDAMSLGKPLICIETGGYTNFFNQKNSIVIPFSSREQIICNLTNAIIELVDLDLRKAKGKKAKMDSLNYNWDKKGKQVYNLICNAYEKYK